jgi:hypothetical protein
LCHCELIPNVDMQLFHLYDAFDSSLAVSDSLTK